MKFILALILFLTVSCKYEESVAVSAVGAVCWAYCSVEKQKTDDCGYCSRENAANGLDLVFYHNNNLKRNPINMAIFKQEETEIIHVAFSGTQRFDQTLDELFHLAPISYGLHDIPGAEVVTYFLNHYDKDFRAVMLKELAEIVEANPGFRVVFSGHSMGAAVSSIAALDSVLSGVTEKNQTKIYNFGQPRVANKAYADEAEEQISEIYRVNHHRDIFTHVPPCHQDWTDVREFKRCVSKGMLKFYPW